MVLPDAPSKPEASSVILGSTDGFFAATAVVLAKMITKLKNSATTKDFLFISFLLKAKLDSNDGKKLGITNFRFPGGDSLGYRWKKAMYDFEDRYDNAPLAKMENVIKLVDIAGAGLVMQVNVESGTPQEAAELVHYMNMEMNSRVDYWELGNEVYGDWDRAFMTGQEYAKLIKEYSSAMKNFHNGKMV